MGRFSPESGHGPLERTIPYTPDSSPKMSIYQVHTLVPSYQQGAKGLIEVSQMCHFR